MQGINETPTSIICNYALNEYICLMLQDIQFTHFNLNNNIYLFTCVISYYFS